MASGNYRFWVRAFDSIGNVGAWSQPTDFRITQQVVSPTLHAPSGTISENRPQFQWSRVTGAARYEIWVTNVDSGQRILHNTQITSTTASPSQNLTGGNYRFWVRAFDSAGNATNWSDPMNFRINQQASGLPTPIAPQGNVTTRRPTFEWQPVSGAARYELWVTSLASGQRVLHNTQITATSATPSADLPAGGYRFWVRAFDAQGNASAWSAPMDFAVQAAASSPQLTGPSGTVHEARPAFTWQAVNGAVRYELWVTDMNSNRRVLHHTSLTGTSARPQADLPDSTYRFWVRAFDAQGNATVWSNPLDFVVQATTSGQDDRFEPNNRIAEAADLGTLRERTRIERLVLNDDDWYRFTMEASGTADHSVSVFFRHADGDIDLALYNSQGQRVRVSDSSTDNESLSLNGLGAGNYFIRVYGYNGSTNPSYSLEINPPASQGNQHDRRVLYLNFDGINITHNDLVRWAGNDWRESLQYLDPERDGVRVAAFQGNNASREQYIRAILDLVQQQLDPVGIRVMRHTGGAIEGVGATTIFVGNTNMRALQGIGGIACDIDYGNTNVTDIAFVNDMVNGNFQFTIRNMADTIIHEAGHTWGLFHVDTLQDGTVYAETMGFIYTINFHRIQITQDQYPITEFMDRTFTEYIDANGGQHGGGRGSQNTYRTLLSNFGHVRTANAEYIVTVDTTQQGEFRLTSSAISDDIRVRETSDGRIEITLNGSVHVLSGAVSTIRIFTNGDQHDSITIEGDLSIQVVVHQDEGTDLLTRQKLAGATTVAYWNGTDLHSGREAGHSGRSGCSYCMGSQRTDSADSSVSSSRRLAGRIDVRPPATRTGVSVRNLFAGRDDAADNSRTRIDLRSTVLTSARRHADTAALQQAIGNELRDKSASGKFASVTTTIRLTSTADAEATQNSKPNRMAKMSAVLSPNSRLNRLGRM